MKFWRALLVLLVVGSLGWVVYQYTGASGKVRLHYQFDHQASGISAFEPHGRALDLEQNQDNGETYQRLVGEPVYFTAQLPSAFERVRVTLEYQNPNQQVIELGLKRTPDELVWDYQMQPLENKFVDNSGWDSLIEGDYQLLQRKSVFNSVSDLLAHPPVDQHIGTYLFNPEILPLVDNEYTPSARSADVQVPIQGKHDIYVYVGNESLEFNTTYNGADEVTLELWHQDVLLQTRVFSSGTQAELNVTNVQPGVYRIVVNASDAVVFTRTQSAQERLVFGKQLKVVGDNSVTVQSPADVITFMPLSTAGVQRVVTVDGGIDLPKVNAPMTWVNPLSWQQVTTTLPTSNIFLIADSYIALDGAEAFDPWFGFKSVSQYMRPDTLDAVISKTYVAPERLRGWTTATAEFDLYGVTQGTPNTLQFVLSAPGLGGVPEGLKVRSITVEALQDPITFSTVWNKLTKN